MIVFNRGNTNIAQHLYQRELEDLLNVIDLLEYGSQARSMLLDDTANSSDYRRKKVKFRKSEPFGGL